MTDRNWYIASINRVVDHIDAHLAEPLDLENVGPRGALLALAFSSAFPGVHRRDAGRSRAVLPARKRGDAAAGVAAELALRIALDVGFGSAEVFTRAFRAHFGVTPTGGGKAASAPGRASTRWNFARFIKRIARRIKQPRLGSPSIAIVAAGPPSPKRNRKGQAHASRDENIARDARRVHAPRRAVRIVEHHQDVDALRRLVRRQRLDDATADHVRHQPGQPEAHRARQVPL